MGAWPVQVMVKDTGRTNGHRASFLCCGQSRRVHSLPRPPDHCRYVCNSIAWEACGHRDGSVAFRFLCIRAAVALPCAAVSQALRT